ncbi:hypothetical protein BC941DRAFT_510832 [Chlamydoabsidia padenii]|nr:hypothetical protein BC941DRAFT_510832 [Chlamydoabsidia padenii]
MTLELHMSMGSVPWNMVRIAAWIFTTLTSAGAEISISCAIEEESCADMNVIYDQLLSKYNNLV